MPVSWIELSLAACLLGASWTFAAPAAETARYRAILCGGIGFVSAVLACIDFFWIGQFAGTGGFPLLRSITGPGMMSVDELNAPLLPLTALVFLVTMLATLRTKVRRFSFARTLVTESLVLATLSSRSEWLLISFLLAAGIPPALELRARHQPLRLYTIHMAALAACLLAGWWLVSAGMTSGYVLIAIGLAIRCGLLPFHCWLTSLFERATLGTALLTAVPLTGALAAVRLLIPSAPAALLRAFAIAAAVTALYAAAIALVQTRARRFFCYIFLSHSALVLGGLSLPSLLSLTGALSLWISVMLAMTGLGLTLRSIEARTGPLSLTEFLGLCSQTPTLAAFFLITGLAAVGFPGTIGFFGIEMIIDGAGSTALPLGVTVVAVTALNGISIVRAYAILFLGARYPGTADLICRPSERLAILILTLFLLGGAVRPQPAINSRLRAAQNLFAAPDSARNRPLEAKHHDQ